MFNRVLALAMLSTLVFHPVLEAEDLPPANQAIPAEAVLVAEISEPEVLFNPLLKPELAKAVAALTAGQKPNLKLQQLQGAIAYLELQLSVDWRSGLRQMAGKGITFSVVPGGGMLLSVDAQEPKLLEQLHEIVRHFATTEAAKANQPGRVSSKVSHGATAWTLATNEAHVIVSNRLFLANHPALLDRVLELRCTAGQGMASKPAYQAARTAIGPGAAATVFLDLQALRALPKVKQALAAETQPLGALLLADTKEALRTANWLAVGVFLEHDRLILKAFTDGQTPETSKTASFTTPQKPNEGVYPRLSVAGQIASVSLFRDLRAFYAAKDDLFAERTSGLIFFENMMGIFFSGLELTDGVLGETRPDLRIVVAEQKYDPAIGIPEVQVPAFAAVLHLRRGPAFGEAVEEAWQKALGLVNFTRGQKALPGLVIDHAVHSDVKYTLSYYRPPADKEKTNAPVDARYNYRPALARPGDYVVISSTDGLARDLIDALKKESAASVSCSPSVVHSVAELDGGHLRAILLANREHLVRKNMVEKGNSREQAEGELGVLLTLLDAVERAELTLSRVAGHPQAQLALKLRLPEPLAAKKTP